jgi:hypothetical protein
MMRVVACEIMFVELTCAGGRVAWFRIARVTFSKTMRTACYAGRELRGEGRGRYRDDESGDHFWIQRARVDGRDRGGKDRGSSIPVAIDDDVRQEYWSEIRGAPERAHERVIPV